MGMKAAIYLRISRDPKADGLANERQLEDCQRLATLHDWDVVDIYQDTASASKRTVRRPEYDRMRSDFAARRFDALICWDLDRLTRQPRQLEDWIEDAEERGLRIITANGEADLSTDGGRMYARIKASVARGEVERKSARQKRANQQRADDGLPHSPWRVFGWERDGLSVRESEAVYLRGAVERILDGQSLRSVLRWFEENEVRTPRGGPWLHTTLRTMLLRERMAGILVRRGEIQEKSRIEPIVPLEQWEEMRALLTDPRRRTSQGRPSAYWLASVLDCPCGKPLAGKVIRARGSVTPSYVCRSTVESGYAGSHVTIAAPVAESAGRAALYFALADRSSPGTEAAGTTAAREAVAEIDERIARTESAYEVTGSQSSLSRLHDLRAERDAAQVTLDIALADLGATRVIAAARRASGGGALSFDSLADFMRSFEVLDVDQKRALAKANMRGLVRKGMGKGAKRILWTTLDGQPLFAEDDARN